MALTWPTISEGQWNLAAMAITNTARGVFSFDWLEV